MPTIEVDGQLIQFPDDMSDQEISDALLRFMPPQKPTQPSDVPVLDSSGRAIVEPSPAKPTFSTAEYLKGLGEVGLAIGTGATTGLLGQVGGAIEGIGKEILSGQFGTPEAATRAEKLAMQRAEQFTAAPSTPAGQYLMGQYAEAMAPLAALPPTGVMEPALAQQLARSAEASGLLRTVKGQAEQAQQPLTPIESAAASAEQALQRNIPVMGSDVAPPTTAVGRQFRSAIEKLPFFGTGGMRRSQQEARIEAVRSFLQDAGATDVASASPKVMRDLADVRDTLIKKYSNDKKSVIDSLSQPVYVKPPGAGKEFVESARPVQMTNLNNYIDNVIQERGIARRAEAGNRQDIALLNELQNIKSEFSNARLSDVEEMRKRLGERFQAPSLGDVKTSAKSIIDGMYGPVVEDMSGFIEAYGGKEDKLKWKRANRKLKENIDDLKDRAFAKMLRNAEADPEAIANALTSGKKNRINMVYRNLSPQGKRDADRLFLSRASQAASNVLENGDTVVDPDKFNKFISKHNAVLDAMTPSARDEVRGLSKALTLTRQAKTAAEAPPTGISVQTPVLAILANMIGGTAGVATAVATGSLAGRYIESPKRVRSALERLGRAPKGSNAEQIALKAFNTAVIAENNRAARQAEQEARMQEALRQNPPAITVTRGQ